MRTLILIDAKNALYRYGHTMRNLRTSEGRPTGVLYGITTWLLRLKKKYPKGRFVMVWDGIGPSWRHKEFPRYKAHRKRSGKMPDVVRNAFGQIKALKELLSVVGIPQIELPGVEADDLIGVLALREPRAVVCSGDKDFLQLMRLGVTVIRQGTTVLTERDVKRLLGCTIRQVLCVRALAGDSSDGIPGIKGIGGKTAVKLVQAGIKPWTDECIPGPDVPKRWASILMEQWATVQLNYKLMKIARTPYSICRGPKLSAEMQHILDVVDGPVRRSRYSKMIRLLGDAELTSLMEQRRSLWGIQGAGLR